MKNNYQIKLNNFMKKNRVKKKIYQMILMIMIIKNYCLKINKIKELFKFKKDCLKKS